MSNHKWNSEGVCKRCGLKREKKQYRRAVNSRSVLKNGVFEDVPVYQYGTAWHYGEAKFERPPCKTA